MQLTCLYIACMTIIWHAYVRIYIACMHIRIRTYVYVISNYVYIIRRYVVYTYVYRMHAQWATPTPTITTLANAHVRIEPCRSASFRLTLYTYLRKWIFGECTCTCTHARVRTYIYVWVNVPLHIRIRIYVYVKVINACTINILYRTEQKYAIAHASDPRIRWAIFLKVIHCLKRYALPKTRTSETVKN